MICVTSYSHWPPHLSAARESIERALRTGDDSQVREARLAFLQIIAGQVIQTGIIPELVSFLKEQGFDVGEPRASSQ